MFKLKRLVLCSSLLLVSLGGVFAFSQSGGTMAPATPEITGSSEPSWYASQDIGEGITLETVVSFLDTVVDPNTNSPARPFSIVTSLAHGMAVLDHTTYLEFLPAGDVTPYSLGATLDRNLVLRRSPPFEILDCSVTITPKTGFTWGTVRGTVDLDIIATVAAQ